MDSNIKDESSTEEVKIPCQVYSRIVGYIRPTSAWNEGKQQEFEDREMFTVENAQGASE